MKNSYQNDIQTVQLGNIISSVGSLLDRSESMQETLSMFHLEQSAEILLQLLEAGDERKFRSGERREPGMGCRACCGGGGGKQWSQEHEHHDTGDQQKGDHGGVLR